MGETSAAVNCFFANHPTQAYLEYAGEIPEQRDGFTLRTELAPSFDLQFEAFELIQVASRRKLSNANEHTEVKRCAKRLGEICRNDCSSA